MKDTIHIVAGQEQLRALLAELLERESRPDPVDAVGATEMARRLSISRSTLHRMRHQGCPALLVGKNEFRYEPERVLEWLRRGGGG